VTLFIKGGTKHAAPALHHGGRQRHHHRHVGFDRIADRNPSLVEIREIREDRFPLSCCL
jgi:hypothetical protein